MLKRKYGVVWRAGEADVDEDRDEEEGEDGMNDGVASREDPLGVRKRVCCREELVRRGTVRSEAEKLDSFAKRFGRFVERDVGET